MKIVLLGAAGFIGRIAAQHLSSRPEVGELFLVDYNIRDAKKFAKKLAPKCRWAMADVGRAPELERHLEGVDAVASAVGPCAEYEKGILRRCAGKGIHAVSIGDATLSPADRKEINDAFRRSGVAAVSGCGLMPGWTELLSAHFLGGGGRGDRLKRPEPDRHRYLFCSLDRFGGYAFFRRAAGIARKEGPSPPVSPAGCYFGTDEGFLGLAPGRPAGLYRMFGKTVGALGPVGSELSAAFMFWMRGSMKAAEGTSVAVAGAWSEGGNGSASASVEDPKGILAGVLLAEVALKLASGAVAGKGLLPLPDVIGRAEAERIATSGGGKIIAS